MKAKPSSANNAIWGVLSCGYADDLSAVITTCNTELAQIKLGIVMNRVNGWVEDHGFQLVLSKTEIVMITKQRNSNVPVAVGPEGVQPKRAAEYLGVTLDNLLSYSEYISSA